MKLAVIEDEIKISNIIKDYFEARNYEVCAYYDGYQAIEEIRKFDFDLIFLDIMMPTINGFEVCKEIRKNSLVPIVFLTALPNEEFQLKAYQLGAIDYIAKPFSLAVLFAKAQALLSRGLGECIIEEGPLSINVESHQVLLEKKQLRLTKKEFDLLLYLVKNKGIVKTREDILNVVWKDDYDISDRNVDTHIKILRKKLGSMSYHIVTVPKEGYKWEN